MFDQSNLIDHIRQSLIEIENEIPEEDSVQQLFNEALIYLDKDITDDIAKELFLLILSCFSHYTSKLLPLFNQIYETSTKNTYHLIITTSVLFYLTQHTQPDSIKIDYQSLVSDLLNQIVSQIQKSDENSLILFGHEISPQFQTNLIMNLLLLTTLTETLVSDFAIYILTHENPKSDMLIKKMTEKHFIIDVPADNLADIISKMDFSIDSVMKFVPLFSERLFKFVIPQIERYIQNSKEISKTFSIALIQKYSEFDINIKPNSKLIENLSVSDLTPQIIEYLKRYDEKFNEKLYEIQCIENLTEDEINKILLETKNLQFYLNFFQSIKKFHPILSSPELWTNIVSIASISKESISHDIVEEFRLYFHRFVKMSLFEDVFTAMLFSVVPQTSIGMKFVVDLVKDPKNKKKKNFFKDKNMQKFLLKLREMKIIPRLSFWELFTQTLVFFQYNKDPCPLFLYGYLFARGGFDQEFEKITILSQTEESIHDVYEYIIQDKDKYELKENMNEAAISLIACALLFGRFEGMIPVEGITDDIFLPFLAISFDFLDSFHAKVEDRNEAMVEIMSNFEGSQPFAIFKNALKSLENNSSPILTASIDRLLTYLYSLFCPDHFAFHVDLATLKIFLPFLLTGKYKANKMILLSTIFQFSHGEHELNKTTPSEGRDPICTDLLLIFRENCNDLFKFIMPNLEGICNDENMKKTSLNLAIFDESISSLIVNTIQMSSSIHGAALFINFLENFCINTPKIQFQNSSKLEEILQETIKEKNEKESSFVYQFILKNGLDDDLHYLTTYPSLLSYLDPLNNHLLLEILFNILMKDETTATKYFQILLLKSCTNNYLTNEKMIKNYSNEIHTNENAFTKAVKNLFVFDQKNERFILKPEFESLSDSTSNVIISNLLQQISQTNSFIILKSIASSFPFIFEDKSLQIFNTVLQTFNHFCLVFDEDEKEDEQKENKIKMALSALSFLHSTLFSPKILDDFVIWLFDNIKTFTESQTVSFFIVLRSLMNIECIKNILLSQMIKFNLIEVVKNIFMKDLPGGSFGDYFLSAVYSLLESFYCSLKKITTKDEIIINELMKVENPFQESLGKYSAVLPEMQQESFLHLQLERVDDFIDRINKPEPFWLTFDFDQRNENENKNSFNHQSFLSKFTEQSAEGTNILSSQVNFPSNLTNSMLHYLSTKPAWITNCIEDKECFILLPQHHQILSQISSDLKQIELENKDDHELYNMLDLYCNNCLFEKLIEQATSSISDQAFTSLCSLINEIVQKDAGLISLLKCVNDFLIHNSADLKSMRRLVDILTKTSNTSGFESNFINTCGNSLLNLILIPEFREDPFLLANASTLFSLIQENQQPSRIVHLVGFMLFQNDPQIVHKALVLSTKVEKPSQDLLMPIIKNLFDRLLFSKDKTKHNELSLILKTFPDVAHERKKQLLELIDSLLEDSNDHNENQNKEKKLDLIGTLFDILAPKRDKLEIDDIILSPESHFIPQSVRKTDPDFWSIFSRHYPKVVQELYQSPILLGTAFKFLLGYPELVEYNIRHAYFNETKRKLSKEKVLNFSMNKASVLKDTLKQMCRLTIDDYFKTFQVQFIGERFKTRIGDYYRALIKEIFDPKYNFFIYTENKKSFQINPNSNPKNLGFFRFTGQIIARAILEDESLNIHLASSFYKIILQLPFELNDLEEIDTELYNSLNLNKDEEMDSKIESRLKDSIREQAKMFCDGFYQIIPCEQIKIFTPKELDLLICGMPMIDVNDLKKNVEFEYPYNHETPSVKLFFNAIEKWDQEDLSKLVLFITKSSESVVSGFKSLKENGNPIKIAPLKDTELPQSFPLINTLLLPEFDDEDNMNFRFFEAFTDTDTSLMPQKKQRNKRQKTVQNQLLI